MVPREENHVRPPEDMRMSIISKLRDNKKALRIGIILLIINPPLGYLGFGIGGYLCSRYDDHTYLAAASVFYIFTWIIFGVGFILAGTIGVEYAKKYWRSIIRKKKEDN